MVHKFSFPIPAFSINKKTYSDIRHSTKEYKQWEQLFISHMEQYRPAFNRLNQDWNGWGGAFLIRTTIKYPATLFYNAAGDISSRAFDVTNCSKIIQDLIMRYGLAVDDRFVVEHIERKMPANEHSITVELIHIDLAEFEQMIAD